MNRYLVLFCMCMQVTLWSTVSFKTPSSTFVVSGADGSLQIDDPWTNVVGTIELKDGAAGTISGTETVTFTSGTLKTGGIESKLSGVYNPDTGDTITLENGNSMATEFGTITQTVTVDSGATVTISGHPQFSSAIALGDASSVLQIDISSSLNQDVTGAGTLSLQSDLAVESGVAFPSLVDFNNNTLRLEGGSYSSAITWGTAGSIELHGDTDVSSTWAFSDDVTINGFNNTLTVTVASGLSITGAKTLTLKNMTLVLTQIDSMACLSNDAHIHLENVKIETRDNDFDFDTGHLDITGLVRLTTSSLLSDPSTVFTFSSQGNLTIGNTTSTEPGTLQVERNVELSYAADPSNDGTNTAATKRHLIFAYAASNLFLDGCTLTSTATGLALETGTVTVKDDVIFNISTSAAAEAELKSNVNLDVLSSAILDVQGPLRYIA